MSSKTLQYIAYTEYITKYMIFKDILIKKKSRCTKCSLGLSSLKPVISVVRIKSGSLFRNLTGTEKTELRP